MVHAMRHAWSVTLSLLLPLLGAGLAPHEGHAADEGRQRGDARRDALRALCQRLEIGLGAVVADVGCGDGPDSMVFAEVVGGSGTVVAQEIDTAKLRKVVDAAGQRGLHHVVPVLGRSDNPHLPDGYADLIYMNRVFHAMSDPDLPQPLDAAWCASALPLPPADQAEVVFVGLDRGRELLPALRRKLGPTARLHDIVLEEWAIAKDEVPAPSADSASDVLRTADGDLPMLTDRTLHAAVFADSYHRLWEPAKLLDRLRQCLRAGGAVVVLDRIGLPDESRRLAGHHRRMARSQVQEDMRQAGFTQVQELPAPTPDRFLLVFRAAPE